MQIVATVNAGEISIHQLNHVLVRAGADEESARAGSLVRREALQGLVEQQLAVERAVELGLERSADVVMAMDAARREVLARAYLESLNAALPAPTEADARRYFADHPQLFGMRRIFTLQEVLLPAGSELGVPLREMLGAGRPLEDIARWLGARGIAFSGGTVTRAAEQIPLGLLERIVRAGDGQAFMIDGPREATTVMRVASSLPAPVSEQQALPRIREFLAHQRADEAKRRELEHLRRNARIAYFGEFADEDRRVASIVTANPQIDESTGAAIERGVAGLR